MLNVEGFPEVFGGSIPAEIWHDFMTSALRDKRWLGFHEASFTGYDKQPDRSVPLPAPSPTPSPSPSPSPECKHPPCKPKP